MHAKPNMQTVDQITNEKDVTLPSSQYMGVGTRNNSFLTANKSVFQRAHSKNDMVSKRKNSEYLRNTFR